jgi:hypothetical protein
MYNDALRAANELAEAHEANIQILLKRFNMTREDMVKVFMTRPGDLPIPLLKEVYCLASFTRLVNMVNYKPVDRKDWRPKDFLDAMMSELYKWAESQETSYLEEEICCGYSESDEEVFDQVLVAAVARQVRIDDEQIREQPILLSGSSVESGAAEGQGQET